MGNHSCVLVIGPKKYQKMARMYDRTGLNTKCALMKTSFKNHRTGTKANFRPFVDALCYSVIGRHNRDVGTQYY